MAGLGTRPQLETSIADAEEAGFNELQVPAAHVLKVGRSQVALEAGLLAEQCREDYEAVLVHAIRAQSP